VICVVSFLAVSLARGTIADAFPGVDAAPWLWIVPVSAFFYGAYEVVSQYAVRHRKYGVLGKRSLIQNLTMSGTQLGLGFIPVQGGLLVGQLLGKFTAILFTFSSDGLATQAFVRDISPKNMRRSLKANWQFPAFLMPSALLNTLGTQAPFVIVGILYGAPIVGLLGLVQRVLGAPAALVSQAVSSVYMGESSSRMRGNAASNLSLFMKATAVLVAISAPFFLVVFLVAPFIFAPIFGAQWEGMGDYAQAMSLGFFLQFVVSPVSQTLVINGARLSQFAWDLGRVIAVILAIYVSRWSGGDALTAVWVYSVTSAVCYGVLWAMCLLKARSVHRYYGGQQGSAAGLIADDLGAR
jgi:O-antigen/teichoic acid export membrane protein